MISRALAAVATSSPSSSSSVLLPHPRACSGPSASASRPGSHSCFLSKTHSEKSFPELVFHSPWLTLPVPLYLIQNTLALDATVMKIQLPLWVCGGWFLASLGTFKSEDTWAPV